LQTLTTRSWSRATPCRILFNTSEFVVSNETDVQIPSSHPAQFLAGSAGSLVQSIALAALMSDQVVASGLCGHAPIDPRILALPGRSIAGQATC